MDLSGQITVAISGRAPNSVLEGSGRAVSNVFGQITITTSGRVPYTNFLYLSGRITATTSARAPTSVVLVSGQISITTSIRAPTSIVFVSGQISIMTSGQLPPVNPLVLSGLVGVTSSARAFALYPFYISSQISITASANVLATSPVPVYGTIVSTTGFSGFLSGVGPNLSGTITTSVLATALFPGPNLYGRITTSVSAELLAGPGPYLYGRISTSIKSWFGVPPVFPLIGGIITTTSSVSVLPSITGLLSGRIKATASANIHGQSIGDLSGRITTISTSTPGGIFSIWLSGQISISTSASVLETAYEYLSGNISITSSAQVFIPTSLNLSGQITLTTSAKFFGTFPQTIWLAGVVTSTVSAEINTSGSNFPVLLSGYILSNTAANAFGQFALHLLGGTTSFTTSAYGFAGPWYALTSSTITIEITAYFGIDIGAELVKPLPPYPAPFPTQPVEHYQNYITSEHNQKPKYMQTIGFNVDPYVQDQLISASLPGLFDLDYAVGEQEDFVGEWIGKSRWIEVPTPFFSWDEEGIGWNQANWMGPFDAPNKLQRLDDYHFRLLLYAAIIANHWNGSIPGAYEAWDTLFHYTGLKVVIQDFGNMTMMYGLVWESEPDMVLKSLFVTGQMDLKPEGIMLIDYVMSPLPNTPLFGFDATGGSVDGWEIGAWGTLQPPGLSVNP